jgi:hypothetical protein
MSVSCECCVVEVSATGWSLVQRSPTDCGVSPMCAIMKPRRNEEAQAHIGLSSHGGGKKGGGGVLSVCVCLITVLCAMNIQSGPETT